MKKNVIVLLATCLISAGGCTSMATGMLRRTLGIGKSDDNDVTSILGEERKLKEERGWIQYWRDNPDANPEMTEAFKNDYR